MIGAIGVSCQQCQNPYVSGRLFSLSLWERVGERALERAKTLPFYPLPSNQVVSVY